MTFTIEETVSVVITGDLTPSHRLKIQSLIKGEKLYISIHNQMITIDDVSEKDAYLTISVQIYVINTRSEKRIPITLTGNLLVHTPDVLNFKQHYIVTLCGSISGVVDCKVAPEYVYTNKNTDETIYENEISEVKQARMVKFISSNHEEHEPPQQDIHVINYGFHAIPALSIEIPYGEKEIMGKSFYNHNLPRIFMGKPPPSTPFVNPLAELRKRKIEN